MTYILAIDQGTTSTRAMVFNEKGQTIGVAQQEFRQYFPEDGWVEHDPEEIWQTTLTVCREVVEKNCLNFSDIKAIGITNQRETTIIWDRKTGRTIAKAIVWQDRRTADFCQKLKQQELEGLISEKTGLLIDPYFSASKIHWLLQNVSESRSKAEAGELAFGTIDTFLLWRLTGGKSHKTDATNASRTMLFNINSQEWDKDLLEIFKIPQTLLPEVCDCSADFGMTDKSLFGVTIPITGMAGDQQAALIGQACFEKGMAKSTYGTGCFVILNTGDTVLRSKNRLLSTIAYRLNGKVTYGIEGSIFVAGAAIQWLRDGLKLINNAKETEQLALQTGEDNSVYLVPAFTGLGAPYWDPKARGAIFGLTRDTGIAEIVTAGLQAVCYQTKDLIRAMENDGAKPCGLRIDGGMVVNNWVVQFLADLLNLPVDRPRVTETTALGAAYLAGLYVGVFQDLSAISALWQVERHFTPNMDNRIRDQLYQGWVDAVSRVRTIK